VGSSYVPLHLRSNYSLLSGASPIEDLVAEAKRLGLETLALTDEANFYGAVRFYKLCKREGIRPILGVSLGFQHEGAVALAENLTGYSNLCRVISEARLDPGFSARRSLLSHSPGLVVLSENVELLRSLRSGYEARRLYLELVPQRLGRSEARRRLDSARAIGVRAVATPDAYFARPEEFQLHKLLRAISKGELLQRLSPRDFAHPESCLRPGRMMRRLMREYPEAIRSTRVIAERCNLELPLGKRVFPRCHIPGGRTAHEYLAELCRSGFRKRYPGGSATASRRLSEELALIEEAGLSEYFVIVGGIVRFARSRGIACVGRGSGASSMVSYCLGVTNVDPIRYRLYFQRFLHERREDLPDLDVDFCWRRRDEVLGYVYDRYGEGSVAMISTHNTMGPRSAFREVAKASGIPNGEVNRLARHVPRRAPYPPPAGQVPGSRADPGPPVVAALAIEPLERIGKLARAIESFPRHLSVHPGGVVIGPLAEYVPLERARKGVIVTQYEMRAVEEIGLVKIDLLGNRAVSTIGEAAELIQARSGRKPDLESISHEDEKTARLLSSGRTLGCFQIESPAMRNILRMLKVTSLDGVIDALSLIRPGPSSSGMRERFVRRALGEEPVSYLDERLAGALGPSLGIMLYEEDVMAVASIIAGITLEQADLLGRAISGLRGDTEKKAFLGRYFISRAVLNGTPRDRAERIWDHLCRFAGYSFCRAHAAGYGVLAYQAAYLKAHHPAEYAVAVLNNHQGMYPLWVQLEEVRRMGVPILPLCVNSSQGEFSLEDGAVRVGFSAVKGLAGTTIERILRERDRAPFQSLSDFASRVRPSMPELESIVLAGGFDFTGKNRAQLTWLARSCGRSLAEKKTPRAGVLFSAFDPPVPGLHDFAPQKRMLLERHVLGFSAAVHPMRFLEAPCPGGQVTPATDLAEGVGETVRVRGLFVAGRSAETSSGKRMSFMTLDDGCGLVECVFFPAADECLKRSLRSELYTIRGRVESDHGAVTVNVEAIEEEGSLEEAVQKVRAAG